MPQTEYTNREQQFHPARYIDEKGWRGAVCYRSEAANSFYQPKRDTTIGIIYASAKNKVWRIYR